MKKVLIASAALVLATIAPSARAEDSDFPKPKVSPQWFAFELRFAPYWPMIDSQPGLTGSPYHTVFGNMARLLVSAEFDVQILRIPHVGTLGPAFSFGYTQMSAPTTFADGSGVSPENTNLEVFPMYLAAVFRADFLLRDFRIPIVPYAKFGLAATVWRSFDDTGTSTFVTASGQTLNALGVTWGEQIAVGGMLNLDWIDPRAAAALDESAGINHTYIFAEWMLANLDNFGSSAGLRVGTNTVAAGLAFEF